MAEADVSLRIEQADGIATVTLDRPDRHNAFDETMIAALTEAFGAIADNGDARVMVLAGTGPSFCAGGDLNWMRRMADYDDAENIEDARRLADMLRRLDTMPQPTIALVHGAAFGGGVGLAAACDVVLAAESARFCLSEVRMGLIPAVISPFVLAAIGANAARRYFLSAEQFGTDEAHRLGLVHGVVAEDRLAAEGAALAALIAKNGRSALRATKRLIADVAGRPIDDALMDDLAQRIARIRAGDEAREGIAAFFEKRPPSWRQG